MSTIWLAAAAGSTISLWDVSKGQAEAGHTHQVAGHDHLGSGSWQGDQFAVVNVVRQSGRLLLTTPSSPASTIVDLTPHLKPPETLKAVAYAGQKLKHLAVAADARVFLYDVSAAKIRKEFRPSASGTLTCLAVNTKDTHLAVGGTGGLVQIFNANSGVASHPLVSSQLGNLVAIRYNVLRTSVLAGGSESGTVCLWDCHANKMVHSLTKHRAPCSGIAFSPINNKLLASSGLDKKCFFYDLETKEVISTIRMTDPVTSLDISPDGMSVALGSSKGSIDFYDLRSHGTPFHRVPALKSAISWLSYSPLPSRNGSSPFVRSVKSAKPNKMMTKNVESMQEYKENSYGVGSETPMRTPSPGTTTKNDSLTSFFSPVRGDSKVNDSTFSCQGTPSQSAMLSVNNSFSPLGERSLNISGIGVSSVNSRTPTLGGGGGAFSSPLTVIREESQGSGGGGPLKNETKEHHDEEPAKSSPQPKISPSLEQIRKSPFNNKDVSVSLTTSSKDVDVGDQPTKALENPTVSSKESKTPKDSEPLAKQDTISDVKAMLLAFPDVLESEKCNLATQNGVQKEAGDYSGNGGVDKFREEFVKSLQSNALDDFYTDIKRHLWHLDYEMVKNFQHLQDQIEELKSQDLYQTNQVLLEEIDRLKRENDSLKATRKYYEGPPDGNVALPPRSF